MGALLKHLDKSGAAQISSKNWADAFAGAAQTAEKFFVQNIGDRAMNNVQVRITQVGSNDGADMLRIGADTATVISPYGLAAALTSAGAGGVWSAIGIRGYVVTAYNGLGQTMQSLEATFNVDVTTKKVLLSWTAVTGATGYKVYRTEVPGTYGASTLRATLVGGGLNSYTDDGSACGAGTPPTENLTAGGTPNYGTVPALNTSALVVGTLAVGQQFVYWVNRVIPGGTAEAGNPRSAVVEILET